MGSKQPFISRFFRQFLAGRWAVAAFAVCFFSLKTLSQNPTADSLSGLLFQKKQDTAQVNLLTDLAWELKSDDPERAKTHLREAIVLAQKTGFQKGESTAWNHFGLIEEMAENFAAADSFYHKALKIRELMGDRAAQSRSLNNLGNLAETRGDYVGALDFYQKSLRLAEQLGDTKRAARTQFNTATVHEAMGNYLEANQAVYDYLPMVEKLVDLGGQARAYAMLGNIQFELEDFKQAEKFHRKSLEIRQLDGDEAKLADAWNDLANVLDEQKKYAEADSFYQKALIFRQKDGDETGAADVLSNLAELRKHENRLPEAMHFVKNALKIYEKNGSPDGKLICFNIIGDVLRRQDKPREAIVFYEKYQSLAREIGDEKYQQKALKDLAECWAALGDFEKAFALRKEYDEKRWERLSENRAKDFERRDLIYGDQKKQQALDQQTAALKLRDAELEKAGLRQKGLLGGGVAMVLLSLLLYNRNRIRRRANEQLSAQNAVIENERARSESLLLNILPEKVAAELKSEGRAKAQQFESVSVLFTDFKSFTTIAEKMSAENLVEVLDTCFRGFDEIAGRHQIEKIKTIGDAYMCAAGLPEPREGHARDLVLAAIEMRDFMGFFNKKQAENGQPVFEVRLGIHSGAVVAGVVGQRKFAWDIWGDAVNLAARMEQSGEPGRVNISGATRGLLPENEFVFEARGRVAAKNKGEVEMFFVEKIASI